MLYLLYIQHDLYILHLSLNVREGGSVVGRAPHRLDTLPTLPGSVPVTMPELPPQLIITTAAQFKAIAEPTRSRILGIIQSQPATAKQIAARLSIAPGAAGHHLQVLEAAGLAQVVARRQVRGTVAQYYTRTARIFTYALSPEVTGGVSPTLEIMTSAANELAETVAEGGAEERCQHISFPHVRLAPERAQAFEVRLEALVADLLREPHDPRGQVHGICVALFRAPNYLQGEARGAADPQPGAAAEPEGAGE
jgi:DNA-binding transcriptional ArsR family regulator